MRTTAQLGRFVPPRSRATSNSGLHGANPLARRVHAYSAVRTWQKLPGFIRAHRHDLAVVYRGWWVVPTTPQPLGNQLECDEADETLRFEFSVGERHPVPTP